MGPSGRGRNSCLLLTRIEPTLPTPACGAEAACVSNPKMGAAGEEPCPVLGSQNLRPDPRGAQPLDGLAQVDPRSRYLYCCISRSAFLELLPQAPPVPS